MGMIKTRFQQADTDAFLWCQKRLAKQAYYPIIRAISATGDGWIYAVLAFSLITINFEAHQYFFYSCLIGFGLEVPLYILLKRKFRRNRPQDYLQNFQAKIKPSDQFSFPSGHTAAAFVMTTQIVLFFPVFAPLAIFWALSIGLSRVALGVHFPGDIIAGILLGILSGSLAGAIIL
ncbi:MAG: phosphatase PAP2 family protein [Kangiellaceae bacterium]|nr:phosphatase PAP2 family protein [Kangiellaceae bacterium]